MFNSEVCGEKRMPFSHRVLSGARMSALLVVFLSFNLLAQTAPEQKPLPDAPSAQASATASSPNRNATAIDYSKSASVLSVVGPYKARTVPPPQLSNAPRTGQILQNGRMMLSLNDAIAIALENNLDIAIARYNLNIADTDLLRTLGGGQTRGVSTGVVTNTPGGSSVFLSSGAGGSGAGGTSAGAGGVATGTGGIVTGTTGVGPVVPQYDPVVTGTLQVGQSRTKCIGGSASTSGTTVCRDTSVTPPLLIPSQSTNDYFGDFTYVQGWSTGTDATFTWNNSRTKVGPPSTFFGLNPNLTSNMRVNLRQHLLQGWGRTVNRRFIVFAKNNRRITDSSFRQQIISTVVQIQNIYWDLVNAYENVKVQEEAVRYAQRTLSDNQKQVEIGTLAPIEVVHAQSQLATAQQQLINAQTNLQYQQLLMKNAITRNMSDPSLAAAPVIPTDTMRVTDSTPIGDVQQLVTEALKRRPEIEQLQIDLQNRTITKKAARQGLLPALDLNAFYGGTGTTNTGLGDSMYDAFSNNYRDRGVALQLNIPIRNRVAQADQVRSELEYRQSEMRFQQQQNNIMIDVRNAAYTVQQARAGVEAATKARDYARQSLEAEQKKFALGASTSYLVLQLENQFVQSESSLVQAVTSYEKARVDLDRATGYTLERAGIQMPEAVSGTITHTPQVPDVTPRTDIEPTQMQQTPQK
jgi:outer membrane protein